VIADLNKYPELRILNHSAIQLLPAVALAAGFLLVGGWSAFVWGFLVSTVLLWHGSFSINSLSHLFGKRRYETSDDSRNNWALALLTTGEGWHNNHHHYQSSANQGFRWWEIDVTFYVLRLLERLGLVWDLRRPPREVVAAE
jgi:stearoyl-CoA desaturase (delta-9 desaturase)